MKFLWQRIKEGIREGLAIGVMMASALMMFLFTSTAIFAVLGLILSAPAACMVAAA